MRLLRWVFAIFVVIVAALVGACVLRTPEPPAEGSESAQRLGGGPRTVASLDLELVDAARPTAANEDFAGAPARTLDATLWFPEGQGGAHPLVVYSHGFMSRRDENAVLAGLLASHGYVVIAVDYPLSSGGAPGGPTVRDVVNQPGDVRFLIDTVLAWEGDERPFAGEIDRGRIAAVGLSLGGLTTELVTFHPRLRDPRIAAAVSIAGPAVMFTKTFFESADVPFLMIAGTGDAMIPYAENAAPIPGKVRTGGLLSIEGASHAGFADFADMFPLRLLSNPDSLGCLALTANLQRESVEEAFPELGGEEEGVRLDPAQTLPCTNGTPDSALHAGRQLMISRLAALAFLQSRFAESPEERDRHVAFLRDTLARDFPEARFVAAGS